MPRLHIAHCIAIGLMVVFFATGLVHAQATTAANGKWKELSPIPLREFGNSILALAFSPDGKTLAAGLEDNSIRLFDVTGRKEIGGLKGHRTEISTVAFAPDGKSLASGSADGFITVWDVAEKKPRFTFEKHIGSIKCLRFSADGKMLATASADKTARILSMVSGKETKELVHDGAVFSLAFSPLGTMLVTGGVQAGKEADTLEGVVRIWELPSGKERRTIAGFNYTVVALAMSADGRQITAATGGRILKTAELKKIQTATGKILETHPVFGHPSVLTGDGSTFGSRRIENEAGEKFTSMDGAIIEVVQLWDASTGKAGVILGKQTITISALAFSADGKTVALASSERNGIVINLWTLAAGK